MKLNRQGITMIIALAFVLVGGMALLLTVVNAHGIDPDENILEYLQDGMKDDAITKYYAYDIEQINSITNSPIHIRTFDVDLNEDGWMDKLVIVQSTLHSGSQGDAFEILKKDGDDYKSIFYATFKLCAQDENSTPYGEVYILESTHDNFHDIQVITEQNKLILTYDPQKGKYDF